MRLYNHYLPAHFLDFLHCLCVVKAVATTEIFHCELNKK